MNRFGEHAKEVYNKCIYQIVDIDAAQVADYAVTYNSVTFILKGGQKKPQSIVPEKPDATGLVHFYKSGTEWNYVTADEYEAKKDELPAVCFATHHPIADFANKKFPEISGLEAALNTADAATDSKAEYYAKYTISEEDSEVRHVTATESQALNGGCVHDMNPVLYIRSKKPASNAKDVIPQVKLTDFFERVEKDESIAFDILRTTLSDADLDPIEIRDEKSKSFIKELKNFTPAEDGIMIAQIDKFAKSKGQSASSIKYRTIEPSEFTWSKDSALAKKDEDILKLRCKLLLKLVKAWSTLQSISSLEDKEVVGSIGHTLFSKKYLVPPSVLSKIVDEAVNQVSEGYGGDTTVSRRKAFMFGDSGKIDHEAKYSMYGQIIQQLAQQYPDLSNFRKKSTDAKAYECRFKGEGSIDAGGPFRESLTDIAKELELGVAPLLIRSPNNKNEHGTNRDCFILDSRNNTPSHKLMFKYLGAFLAYAFLSKSPIAFNFAPWVWKQLLQQEVTMYDLEEIDTYSAQVLRDLQQYAQDLSDADFDAGVDQCFTTVLSTSEEVPICPNGENI